MDVIITNAIELLRYKIVSLVNTGDKVTDNLLCVLIMAIITYFGKKLVDSSSILWTCYRRCRQMTTSDNYIINPDLYDRSRKIFEKLKIKAHFNRTELLDQFYKWAIKTYPNGNFGSSNKYILTEFGYVDSNFAENQTNYTLFKMFPAYHLNDDILYIHYDPDWTYLYLCCNNLVTLTSFLKTIKCIDPKEVKLTDPAKVNYYVYDCLNENDDPDAEYYKLLTTIDKDRTLDNMVFSKKAEITRIIQDFEKSLTNKNIYHLKNLGILLYGPPGTGKTFFMKAMCNYFKRSAVIFNFFHIKSKKRFVKLFEHAIEKKYIIIFDEIDYLLDTLEKKEKSTSPELAGLENAIKSCTDEKLIKELQKKYIDSCLVDDSITLYTLLTLLDGICEHSGRIVLGTTNNIEKIHKALLRPQRFDVLLKLGRFSHAEIHELLEKIFDVNNRLTNNNKETNFSCSLEDMKLLQNCTFPSDTWTPCQVIMIANMKKNLGATIKHLIEQRPE
jgi:hypothetical protein